MPGRCDRPRRLGGILISRPEKYDILFQPIQLGPKLLPNRFWQVPHCNGGGVERPAMQAAFRGMKAEGGWGAVFTEACSVSPDSDFSPYIVSKLWDDDDVRSLASMCDAVHEHGGLAGVQLVHGNSLTDNAETRAGGRVVSQLPNDANYKAGGRELDKDEIAQLRRDHVAATLRGRAAGFDLITIDAGIGNLVDADLAKESARLQALQTKQQLGVQALSIANQSSSILLGLFR